MQILPSHLKIFIFLSFLKFITGLEILEGILTNKANYQLNTEGQAKRSGVSVYF